MQRGKKTRPTTREGVHLVTRGHLRSRDKDSRHTIPSAIAENPMLHTNLIVLFMPLEVCIAGIGIFEFLFLLP